MAARNRPNRSVTLVKLLGVLVVTGVLAAGVLLPVVGGIGLTGKAEADRFLSTDCQLNETGPSTKTTLFASDGTTVIAQLFSQNRTPIVLSQIPLFMQKALVDTEDRRFYEHHGVDMRGLLRAAVSNSSSSSTQGGSTLTMQYVKQLRLYNATTDAERIAAVDQTIDRKIQDAKCALDLETRESKSEILQNYFNIAFFGENSYGVESAAATYFAKDASKLTLPEAAMIVGLVQAPTQYDPFQDPQAATARRNQVLDNMVTAGDITATEATTAKATPLGLATTAPPAVAQGCAYSNPAVVNAGFFCDYAVSWLAGHGFSMETLQRGGLNIVTTLDAGLQTSGENAVLSGPLAINNGTPGAPFSPMTLVMPSVDPKTGNVTTMITSRHYGTDQNDPGQTTVPLFTTPAAGAGSTYKYFTAATALTSGAPSNLVLTTAGAYPSKYTTKNCPKDNGKAYQVSNAGNYAATLPMDKALYESSNTYFVGLEDMYFGCYTRPISDMAVNLGMKSLTTDSVPVNDDEATFTLGQHATSPLELTSAYATIANDGVYCPPNAILKITDSTGKNVPVTKDGCSQKLDPQVARTLVSMLIPDTTSSGGTATSAFRSWYGSGGSQVASKTGTNNATTNGTDNGKNSALWFVGITPKLVSAAAIINFASPTSTVTKLPGFSDSYAQSDAFGATSGKYWLEAYGPTLQAQPWSWPSVASLPGNTVPSVTGQTPAAATAMLAAAGYRANILSYPCGSSARSGTISGYSPTKAVPGATITACVSNGKAPTGYAPPTGPTRAPGPRNPGPVPAPGPATVTNANGGGNGGGGNGGGGNGGGAPAN